MNAARKLNQHYQAVVTEVVNDTVAYLTLTHFIADRKVSTRHLVTRDNCGTWLDAPTGQVEIGFLPTTMMRNAVNDYRRLQRIGHGEKPTISRPVSTGAPNQLIRTKDASDGREFYVTKYVSNRTARKSNTMHAFRQAPDVSYGVLDGLPIFYDEKYKHTHERGNEIVPCKSLEDALDFISKANSRTS